MNCGSSPGWHRPPTLGDAGGAILPTSLQLPNVIEWPEDVADHTPNLDPGLREGYRDHLKSSAVAGPEGSRHSSWQRNEHMFNMNCCDRLPKRRDFAPTEFIQQYACLLITRGS
jgi:hypothetical protein